MKQKGICVDMGQSPPSTYKRQKKDQTQHIVSLHLNKHMLYIEGFWQNTQTLVTVTAFGEGNIGSLMV